MLKNVPAILSPELLKIMREMGHGDVIILADANFPGASNTNRLVRLDGVEVTDLLDAVLRFLPLDAYVPNPVSLMKPEPQDPTPVIWKEFSEIIKKHDDAKAFSDFELIERMDFYDYAKKAYAIVQTGATAHYANICIKKGVL